MFVYINRRGTDPRKCNLSGWRGMVEILMKSKSRAKAGFEFMQYLDPIFLFIYYQKSGGKAETLKNIMGNQMK